MHGVTPEQEIDHWRSQTTKWREEYGKAHDKLNAIEAALNAANVAVIADDDGGFPRAATLVERIALLVRDRDEARKRWEEQFRETGAANQRVVELEKQCNVLRALTEECERDARETAAILDGLDREGGHEDYEAMLMRAAKAEREVSLLMSARDRERNGHEMTATENARITTVSVDYALEARRLERELADAKHSLANEKQVSSDLASLIGDTLCYLRGSQVTLRTGVTARFSDLIGPALIDRLLAVAPEDVKAKFAADAKADEQSGWKRATSGIEMRCVCGHLHSEHDMHGTTACLVADRGGCRCRRWSLDDMHLHAKPTTPIGEMLANLVVELHALRNAPTDVQGIASTVERLISMTHSLAIAANDTRERLDRLLSRGKDGR